MTDHEHVAIRLEKGTSGLQIGVCECGLRFVPGRMSSPASYLSPDALERLRTGHPEMYERHVTQPRKVNESQRQQIIAQVRASLNGKN